MQPDRANQKAKTPPGQAKKQQPVQQSALTTPVSKPRVLFVLKLRHGYGYGIQNQERVFSSGLYNSAQFVVDILNASGVEAKLVQVVDNNSIDREVYNYKPTHVVLEALWVVPSKFDQLLPLHPGVQWIVRLHSNTPFLACEGIAVGWIRAYLTYPNVRVGVNSLKAYNEVKSMVAADSTRGKIVYLPNYYPVQPQARVLSSDRKKLQVGCFGAIRPLKNQLIQALAAIQYANNVGKTLYFHINSTRQEQGGSNVLKNLRALFAGTKHQLIEHDWMEHADFVQLIRTMDVGMQVSFSETFNIVSADMVVSGIPIVVSPEIEWATSLCTAEPTDMNDIVMTLGKVTSGIFQYLSVVFNQRSLRTYVDSSKASWLSFLKN